MSDNRWHRWVGMVVAVCSLAILIVPFSQEQLSHWVMSNPAKLAWLGLGAVPILLIWTALIYYIVTLALSACEGALPIWPRRSSIVGFASWGAMWHWRKSTIPDKRSPFRSKITNLKWLVAICSVGCFVGAQAIDAALQIAFGIRFVPPLQINSVQIFLGALAAFVVAAPLIETLIQVAGLEILRRFSNSNLVISLVSASAWALFHAFTGSVFTFPSIFFIFYILSSFYLTTRATNSALRCFLGTMSVHAINNLFAVTSIVIHQGLTQ